MENHNSKVIIIVSVLVIALAVAGFLFLQPESATAPAELSGRDVSTAKLDQMGTSDEIPSIEKDLTDTNLSNLAPELDTIEKELSQPN